MACSLIKWFRAVLVLVICATSVVTAQRPGPLWILGRTPDTNPYSVNCVPSTSGTYVPPAASIKETGCLSVWSLGTGTTPNIEILRNGSQAAAAFGAKILYYLGLLYVQGDDLNWYLWDGELNTFQFYSSSDPSMSVTPVGYFVAKTGNDSNTCMQATSTSTPKLTLASGMACLSAGDTLYVRAGTYAEAIQNPTLASGTSWDNKVRITNYPGESPWLHPVGTDFVIRLDTNQAYIEIDGINVDGSDATAVVWIAFFNPAPNQPHHIRLQNAEFKSTPKVGGTTNIVEIAAKTPVVTGGIELRYLTLHGGGRIGGTDFSSNGYGIYMAAPNNLVEFNNLYDNKGCEIQIFNDDGALPNNNVIRNNVIHDETRIGVSPESCGIIVDGASQNQIYNNVIYGILASPSSGSADAIAMYSGTGNKIWNNVFYGNTGGLQIFSGASGTTVQNNVSYANTLFNYTNSGASTTHANNLDDGTNPVFVNAGAANFRLQSTSPARDAGTPLASFFTTDFDGIPRPQGPAWDMGPFEFH